MASSTTPPARRHARVLGEEVVAEGAVDYPDVAWESVLVDAAAARLVRVYLTEHGRAVRGAIERERDDLERRATATLTGAERTAVLSALRKIITQFEITEPPPPGPPR